MLKEIDLSRVDLNLLVLFATVLEERHVGRAAARLNLSPSAVSHGLGRLRRLLRDPLFLRHPKGVVPTARADALAAPVGDVLARVRAVLAGPGGFDPVAASRRFALAATDGISAVVLPPLLAAVRRAAPGVGLGLRTLLPPFDAAFEMLDARAADIAVLPLDRAPPARFEARSLYEEEFVVAMRRGHPLGRAPTPEGWCAAEHLLVSFTGDPHGLVDEALAARGLRRRVALTVPEFMLALAVVGATDLVAAVPERLVALHAARFGLVAAPPPVSLPRSRIVALAPRVALLDEGVAWLLGLLERTAEAAPAGPSSAPRRRVRPP
jgi:DNA-binding transcriptional LysR family regulator